jgi:uncharacterized protein
LSFSSKGIIIFLIPTFFIGIVNKEKRDHMNRNSFLIIHGLGGSGPDHWQTWLANELIQRNYPVCYPTFSNVHSPDKRIWLEELNEAIRSIPEESELTVVTHSLGCLLWLHYAASINQQIAKRVILVAPPSPHIILTEASSFYPVPLENSDLLQASNETLFVHSSNDPYCSYKHAETYLKIGLPSITFPNMGHINVESGHGKWPWILEQCLKEAAIYV